MIYLIGKLGVNQKNIFSKEYEFINLINKESGEAFQILIHQGAIQNNFFGKIKSFSDSNSYNFCWCTRKTFIQI